MNINRFVLVAVIVVVVGYAWTVATKVKSISANSSRVTLTDTRKVEFHPEDYKGKVVFINFWATWCPPCRDEFPELVEVAKKYKGKDVHFVSVSLDDEGNAGQVKSFAAMHGATHQIVVGPGAQQLAQAYGVQGIPANYILNRDGSLKQTWVGFEDGDVEQWKASIDEALQ